MSRDIIKRPKALRDLADAAFTIAQDSPPFGFRFLDAAESTFLELLKMPEIGRLRNKLDSRFADVRVWRVRGFTKYLIFYRQMDAGLEVFRVLHGAQDIESILESDLE